jgi:hypothetical protein
MKAIPSRRRVAKKCIKKLHKIPKSLLEKYTGHKASYTRFEWETAINNFANFQESPYSSDDEGSDTDNSLASQDSEIITESKELIIEIKEIDSFSHLSLAKLVEQFNILLRQLDVKFNPIEYLSRTGSERGHELAKLSIESATNVRDLITKLKDLHILIHMRREEYNRGSFFGCLSIKQKLTALHFCKYAAEITTLSAAGLASAYSCNQNYDAKDPIKILAIVAGLLSSVFEEISFWGGRKETQFKYEVAQLLDAEIVDLNSIDQFTYFINQFFAYVSELPNTSDLDHSSDTQDLSSEGQENRSEIFSSSLPTIGGTVKSIQNTAKRLSGYEPFQQMLARKLTRCLEALKAVDDTYLERIFDQKSAGDTKRMWKLALIDVYEKATGEVYVPRYIHALSVMSKKKSNSNSNNSIINQDEQQPNLDPRIQQNDHEKQEKEIFDDET